MTCRQSITSHAQPSQEGGPDRPVRRVMPQGTLGPPSIVPRDPARAASAILAAVATLVAIASLALVLAAVEPDVEPVHEATRAVAGSAP